MYASIEIYGLLLMFSRIWLVLYLHEKNKLFQDNNAFLT